MAVPRVHQHPHDPAATSFLGEPALEGILVRLQWSRWCGRPALTEKLHKSGLGPVPCRPPPPPGGVQCMGLYKILQRGCATLSTCWAPRLGLWGAVTLEAVIWLGLRGRWVHSLLWGFGDEGPGSLVLWCSRDHRPVNIGIWLSITRCQGVIVELDGSDFIQILSVVLGWGALHWCLA